MGLLRALTLKIHLLSKNLQSKQRELGLLNETPREFTRLQKEQDKEIHSGPQLTVSPTASQVVTSGYFFPETIWDASSSCHASASQFPPKFWEGQAEPWIDRDAWC